MFPAKNFYSGKANSQNSHHILSDSKQLNRTKPFKVTPLPLLTSFYTNLVSCISVVHFFLQLFRVVVGLDFTSDINGLQDAIMLKWNNLARQVHLATFSWQPYSLHPSTTHSSDRRSCVRAVRNMI